MQPSSGVDPDSLSLEQLDKIRELMQNSGRSIAKTKRFSGELYELLKALADRHEYADLQNAATKYSGPRKKNIFVVPSKTDMLQWTWKKLTTDFKKDLTALLKHYDILVPPPVPTYRTMSVFKSELGSYEDGFPNHDFQIMYSPLIRKQYRVKKSGGIFFSSSRSFLLFAKNIWGTKLDANTQEIVDETAAGMRLLNEKPDGGYTAHFRIVSGEECRELHVRVVWGKYGHLYRIYQPPYLALKKFIDALIGKDATYDKMFTPVSKKSRDQSLSLNEEENEEEDEENQ